MLKLAIFQSAFISGRLSFSVLAELSYLWYCVLNVPAYTSQVLQLIQERHNICKQLHLPAQSGSTRVLEAMRRG